MDIIAVINALVWLLMSLKDWCNSIFSLSTMKLLNDKKDEARAEKAGLAETN